ncbi:MAG: BON domain-containing protein [Thermoguttaceae bacterium]|jgi:osmotically-inducible protein OsmY
MFHKEIIPDRVIDQKVSRQLANRGMRPPCHVTGVSRSGTVTLSGKIQYEHQRALCVRAAHNIEGVQRVVDQLQVIVKAAQKAATSLNNPG